jgi:hypothetical protein
MCELHELGLCPHMDGDGSTALTSYMATAPFITFSLCTAASVHSAAGLPMASPRRALRACLVGRPAL